MKTIEVYKTSDGALFESEKQATKHEDDLIGHEIGELLKLMQLLNNIGHQAIYNATLKSIENKKQLHIICSAICNIIEFSHSEDD